ncbi:hypothetical protein N7522_004911 [Penicillium canescens]|uniref:Knr4/Smi1-like domain-containing protein n=1 Tax=Penicillium canescens TaxID=5083 RepID=A0AAD6I1P9_PENCN|nr:uncharacterized protein N7446_004801 [Penicillium canescens]KAJ6009895.1 hypothetical protein N7522_004911 [Penicillium canescens]KAJ6026599.1 hypothetical protein N7460_011416 [Penicillium canescens]KAJ6039882.1 hypothetical protein N7444_008787 [Penicillium canescens]KAJ6067764.1 hypothetical protein N7446_004801 [Penicillium canescens]
MSSTVTRIIEVFNAPEPTTKTAWEVTEAEMEIALPNDYKELIDRMGANATMWEFEAKPPELQIEGSFVIPWATTDNGEYLFWRCLPGQHPDEWTVILNQGRDWTWEHHEMNCTDFLYAALTKEIQSEILSDDFPLSRHVFASFNPAPSHSIRLTGIRRPKRRLKK